MWDTWVRSLDQEDPLEKEMAAHPNILAWEIPWTEEPGGLQSMGSQRVRHDLATKLPPPTAQKQRMKRKNHYVIISIYVENHQTNSIHFLDKSI